jgi:glutamate formiminotransferase/formiminotetrahydrofolate cyclodeaminase
MADVLIECVPNFSEGRDKGIIKQITDVIEAADGVKLLDVDPGEEMNRTVVTFIGNEQGVKEAAFQAIKKAAELIDMSKHQGSHPRMGATDVCPFVPVNGISTEECIELSKEVAKRVADELHIPIYLYEKSAQKEERINLAFIRSGEYEALPEKLKDPQWKPDYGEAEFNAKAGATVIGVREFLIAYNINLNTRESKYATDIAFELREKGRSARRGNIEPFYFKGQQILKYKKEQFPCGTCDFVGKTMAETIEHCHHEHGYDLIQLLNENGIDSQNPIGKSVKKPGLFTNCKAIGWFVPEYGRAQISINLTNYNVTPMHEVLESARKLAMERGVIVSGSEIIGMVPYPAMLQAGLYYLRKQQRSAGIPVKDIIDTAIQSLGLRDLSDFVAEERILGLPDMRKKPLVTMNITDFIDEVSRESAAPGGGSIAALAGSLGAALASMVSNLTTNIRGSEEVDDVLTKTAEEAQQIKEALLYAIDDDTNAFNAYMDARRLPAKTAEEKSYRTSQMEKGLKEAVNVPLKTAENSYKAIEIAETVLKYGNPNSITDVGVGAQIAYTGVKGGIYNVLINLKDINDVQFVNEMKKKCTALEKEATQLLEKISKVVETKILN